MKKINIGAGIDIKEGWDNLDTHNKNGANIIGDLTELPLGIKDKTYDYVLLSHILEHFDDPIPILEEMIRITKKGGKIEIRVPNETYGLEFFGHKCAFTPNTFKGILGAPLTDDYGQKLLPLKIIELKYYPRIQKEYPINTIGKVYRHFSSIMANFFGIELMTHTFLKYVFPLVCVKCVYEVLI